MPSLFIVWYCNARRLWQRVAVLTDLAAAEAIARGRAGWIVLPVVDVRLAGNRAGYPTGSRSGVDG